MELSDSQHNSKQFLRYKVITDREAYDFYRNYRYNVCKGIDQYNYYVKALNGIFILLKKMLAESEGGVYIEGLGYFCMVKGNPRRKRRKSLLMKNIKYDFYFPYFFPDLEFKHWKMDRTFDKSLKFIIRQHNVKRKLYFDVCESIRVAERYARRLLRHDDNYTPKV